MAPMTSSVLGRWQAALPRCEFSCSSFRLNHASNLQAFYFFLDLSDIPGKEKDQEEGGLLDCIHSDPNN